MTNAIAIDGPAGAGKSTVAKTVAKRLGYIYVDTGAMYRCLAIHFINHQCAPSDSQSIIASLPQADVTIGYEGETQQVFLCGENVTAKLRTEEVGNMASISSAIPEVRAKLLDLQRKLAEEKPVVMDGRDIGTQILPDARVKVFLTASAETRAKRRFLELEEKGTPRPYDEVYRDIVERDERDSSRATAPLKQADDATLVDSSNLSIDEVVEAILTLAQ